MTYYIREARLTYSGPRRALAGPLRGPHEAGRYIRRRIGDECVEVFLALALDGRHKPLADYVVSRGTLTASLVHPREVFRPALCLGAAALIVAHNHPSGDPSPSTEDREVTQRLCDAGKLLGVRLVDHLIVTPSAVYSFADDSEEGELD